MKSPTSPLSVSKEAGGIKSLSDIFAAAQLSIEGTIGSIASLLGSFAPIAGVIAGIGAAIGVAFAAWKIYDGYMQKQVQSAKEAGTAWTETNNSLNDYKDRVTELRSQLDSGTLSDQEAYQAKSELLSIQESLADSYGSQVDGIDLVNGSLREQIDLMNQLSQSDANKYLNENQKGIDKATKEMEKERQYFLGQYLDTDDPSSDAIKKAIKASQEKYGNLITTQGGANGETYIYFKGDASQAEDVLNDFMTDVRSASDEIGDSNTLDNIFNYSEDGLKKANKVLEKYQEVYDQAKAAEIAGDTKKYKGNENESKTAAEWMNDYSKAVEQYNEALSEGDSSKIAEAKSEFDSVNESVQSLLGSDMSKYADSFNEIGSQLNTAAIGANEFKDAINGVDTSDSAKGIAETAKELKELDLDDKDFVYAFETDGVQDGEEQINSLVQAALDAGVISDTSSESLQSLADMLIELGIISGEPVEGLEKTTDAVKALKTSLSELQDTQEKVQTALSNSKSATGLTEDDITNLTAAYKDLEGYNPYKLFEETANGVHLNADELEKLNNELSASKIQEFSDQISNLRNQIYAKQAKGEDTSELESQLTSAKLLKSELEGATSAYNKLISAMNGSKERDSYESLGSAYENMKNTLDQGWYGDESLNAYLDLLLSAQQRTGDAAADFEKLGKTIEGTSHSILDYWKYDDDNNLVTDGLYDFLDDVNKKMGDSFAKVNEDGTYQFDFNGDKLKQVADAFGMSTEAVELFERAMIDAGMAVDMTDLDFSGQVEKAVDALKDLQEAGKISDSIDLDFDVDTAPVEDLQSYIDQLKNERVNIDAETNPEAAAALDELISKCEQTYYAKINTETDGSLDTAVAIVEQLKALTAAPLTVEARTANTDQIASLATQLASLPESVQIAVGIKAENVGDVNAIVNQLNTQPSSIQVPVNYQKGTEPEKVDDATGTANFNLGTSPTTVPDATGKANYTLGSYPTSLPSLTQTIIANKVGFAEGTAHADGTAMSMWNNYRASIGAYASGNNWSLMKDEDALVNELGTESIVRNGRWFPIPGGAQIAQLKKGDIIFSAEQTKELIKSGKITSGGGHGRIALADGTAFNTLNLSAYEGGSGGGRRPGSGNSTSVNHKSNSSSKPSSSSSSTTKKKTSSSDNKRKKKNTKKDTEETFDFIEIAIDRVERAIDKLKNKAESVYRSFGTRNKKIKSEISSITSEIKLQQSAYNKYIKKAASVGLDKKWKKKVKNGSLNISEIKDEKLAKKIKSFQEWYEKALACKDTISELNEELATLYEDRFNNTVSRYDGKVSLLDHKTNAYQNDLDILVAKGYKGSKAFYDSLTKNEAAKIKARKSELSELQSRLSDAMNSGKIKEGSQAWYDMQQEINGVKEAIQEAELATINFNKEARELDWDFFEFMEDRISNITKEADFIIDLMSNKKMYDDKTGNITDAGMATMGLHSQNYNVYMAQADQYAEEIKSLNKEIAKDPYNTDLIKHREELLELQRESILSAEDEKQAISDLVEDGINSQLDALKELIDTYTDSLDSAKDLYDYQKKIKEQTSDIASLQKRLSAYSGDTSEESKATIQKIKVDLADAMDELQDTEYDKYISDQKELLDDLYNEYETVLNQRLDDIDALITDVIKAVNENSGTIGDTISKECENAGYTLSESMESIWNNEGSAHNVVSMYGEKFLSNGNATLEAVRSIQQYITSLRNEADAEASKDVSSVTERTAPTSTKSSTTKKKTSSSSKSKKSSSSKGTQGDGKVQVGDKVTYKSGKYYSSSSGANPTGTKNRGKSVYITKINSKGSKPYHISTGKKLGQGDMGWLTKSQISGYARGLRRAKNDEYAWINELSPESIISPTKRAIITHIDKNDSVLNGEATDNIWNMANNPSEFIKNALNNDDINISNDDIENLIKGVFSTGYTKDIMDNIGRVNIPTGMKSATNIGDINYEVNIPIEHVSDYNDFMNQMKKDGRFEKMIQSMTVDRLVGGSKLSKNKFHW